MKKRKLILATIALFLTATIFASTTRYVSPSGSNTFPFTSLATASTSISAAVTVSVNGDVILVNDGTYVFSSTLTINKGITLKSINGSSAAIIDGNNSVKCLLINNPNAVVEGFTVQNGYNPSGFGGGVNIVNGGLVKFCTIKNNRARDGGGVAIDNSGYLENCYVTDNIANNGSGAGYGGGVRLLNGGEIRNCVITGNTSVRYGGGVNIWNAGKVKNCVIAKNTAPAGKGAGIRTRNNSYVYNCIIYYNNGDNWVAGGGSYHFYNSCVNASIPAGKKTSTINSVPMFVDLTPGSENYRLQAGSPAIDAGVNIGWMASVPDLDGNTRIVNGTVDMGAYEYVSAPTDTDGDGVADANDDYPADPLRAFDNFFPSGGFGTLGFEDLWPSKGDYDFNDLVVDYRFKTVTNASNNVVEIYATFKVKAFGAGYRNGFGFQFPNANVAASDLAVSGYDLQEGYISLAANGLEQGQAKPTVIVYDNSFNIMQHPGSGTGVNTEQWAPYVSPESLHIYIAFAGTYTMAQVDIENFNPFLVINKFRNDEVHLPDYVPTDLANTWQFGYADDDSDPSSNRYYKTATNLPWAINIPEPFDYPTERTVITSAHLKFAAWAESDGVLFPNWYQDLPGYRNSGNIYNHP